VSRRRPNPAGSWQASPAAGIALLAIALAFSGASWADTLPPDIREKAVKEQAIGAMKSGDTAALFDAMDEYRTLESAGATVPPGLYFAEADSARWSGDPVRAERAFSDYFRVARPEGEAYAEAQRAYGEFRKSIPEATWSILDAMVPIPGGTVRTGDGTQGGRVVAFSLSRKAVTQGQFDEFRKATGYQSKGQAAAEGCPGEATDGTGAAVERPAASPVVCVSWLDADAFISWLGQYSGLKFRLPSAVELEYATLDGGSPASGADDGSVGAAAAAGSASTNRFGLQDIAVGGSEWVRDCGSDVGGAAEAAGTGAAQACRTRIAVSKDTGDQSSMPGGERRVERGADFRSGDLGFRLSLGR
jgi:formylglycine-generating enzyme required for sulfatase activity